MMSLGFDLLGEDTFWREGVASGSYINRRWVPDTAPASLDDFEINGVAFLTGGQPLEVTGSFATFTGNYEPFKEGETELILPDGVSGEESIIIFTTQNLAVHNDLAGNEVIGTVIYLTDPNLDSDAIAYVISAKQVWNDNTGFTLMNAYREYLATRREKQ